MNSTEEFGFKSIWLEIKHTKLNLSHNTSQSSINIIDNEEECNDIYLKLFNWKDHCKVTDEDVNNVKKYFKSILKLDYLPQIRVKNCKKLGYPVLFDIVHNGRNLYKIYGTCNGIFNIYDDTYKKPSISNLNCEKDKMYCLVYNSNFNRMSFWVHKNRVTNLDNKSEEPSYDLPARFSLQNDNELVLLHFVCSNGVPDKFIEYYDDDLFICWDVVKKEEKYGYTGRNNLSIKKIIKGVYKTMYYSDTYLDKCIEKLQNKVEYDLNILLDEFVNSKHGKICMEEVPNKSIGKVYKLDFTDFLI